MSRWAQVSLGDLGASVPNACVGGPFGSELTTKDYIEAPGVPVIRGSNLREDGFVDDGFVYVSDGKAEALKQNLARPGDIAFTQRGTIGQVAVIPADARYDRYVLSQSQMKLTPDLSRVDPRFIVHYFRSPTVLRFLKHNTLATGVPHINLSILRRVPVPLPSLTEQRRIADILDKADAIRRKRKEAMALTDELLRSTFLEMFGDPVTNPKKLERGELRDFLLTPLRNGLSPATGGQHKAQVLTLSAITRGAFDGGAKKEGAFAADPWPDVRLDERDFLVCRGNGNRDLVGTGAFPDRSDSSVVFPDTMIAVRVDSLRVGRAFLEQLWKSRLVRGHVEASARTTNGTFKVNQGAVEATPILLPEEGELARFESFALRQRILAARQAAAYEDSDALFESLVACAFQGELMRVAQ